jgi:hypothetical protein
MMVPNRELSGAQIATGDVLFDNAYWQFKAGCAGSQLMSTSTLFASIPSVVVISIGCSI